MENSDDKTPQETPQTSLSAGAIIRAVLLEDAGVTGTVGDKIFPVGTDSAELPYIVYRRASLEARPVKTRPCSDSVEMELLCYTSGYGEGVELAERVREALDSVSALHLMLRMRSCMLTDAEEYREDDAYVQRLVFDAGIENARRT